VKNKLEENKASAMIDARSGSAIWCDICEDAFIPEHKHVSLRKKIEANHLRLAEEAVSRKVEELKRAIEARRKELRIEYDVKSGTRDEWAIDTDWLECQAKIRELDYIDSLLESSKVKTE
jgi:hypothetical protein